MTNSGQNEKIDVSKAFIFRIYNMFYLRAASKSIRWLKDDLVRQLSRLRFNSSLTRLSASVFCVFNFSDLPLQTKEARALHVRILNNCCGILLCYSKANW